MKIKSHMYANKRHDVLQTKWFWLFMFFSYFEPAYFSEIYVIDILYNACRIISFGIASFLLLRRGSIPKLIIGIFIYYIVQFIITITYGGNWISVISQGILSLGVTTVIYLISCYARDLLLPIILVTLEFLVYGNFISVIYAPTGLYRFRTTTGWWTDACWFMGIRNGMTNLYLLTGFVEILNVYIYPDRKQAKIRLGMFILTSTFTIICINFSQAVTVGTGSAGALVLLWVIFLAYFIVPKNIKMVNFGVAAIVNYIFFLLLIFFNIQYYFSFIIESLLKKSVTLTGRTILWKRSIEVIAEHFLTGYGVEYGEVMANRLRASASVSTTQNGFLDILYVGGVIQFFIFICIVLQVFLYTKRKKCEQKYQFLIGYITFEFFLCGQTESLVGMRLFAFFMIIYVVLTVVEKTETSRIMHKNNDN